MEQGLLVHGSNHFVVNGREPSAEIARALLREWEMPMLLRPADERLGPWTICVKAFRENLTWAVVVAAEEAHSPAVVQLIAELRGRGVPVKEVA